VRLGSWAVLARVAAELLARIGATKRHLEEIPPAELIQYRPLVETVLKALQRIEQSLLDTVATIPGLVANGLESDAERLLSADLDRLSKWFTTLHQLIVYLPASSVKPETRAVLEQAFQEHYKDLAPTLILGSLFNALEFDFLVLLRARLPGLEEVVVDEASKNIVLQLPLCDRDSPFAWAVLAHEMGHAVDAHLGITEAVLAGLGHDPSNPSVLKNWAQEICADLIAASALGAAPILSVVSLEYCLYPSLKIHIASPTHPPTLARLWVVRDFLRSLNNGADYSSLDQEITQYEHAWDLSLQRTEADPARREEHRQRRDAVFENVYSELLRLFEPQLSKKVPARFRQPNSDELKRCLARLRRRLPIAAQGLPREALIERLEEYRKETSPELRVPRFKELLPTFQERPLGPTEILAASHARRAELIGKVKDAILAGSTHEIASLVSPLAVLDEVVAASVNTTIVHQSYISQLGLPDQLGA
jgi:hypothetical protein